VSLDVEGAHNCTSRTPLNQTQDRVFVTIAATDDRALFGADVGFVDFDDAAFPSYRLNAKAFHGLADAVGKEPSGFQAAPEGALDLAGADALLRRTQEIDGLQPYAGFDARWAIFGSACDFEQIVW
jgi:hypothetical protein